MARFTLVMHSWFVDSNGFKTVDIEAASQAEAEDAALLMATKANDKFNSTAAIAIEWGEEVRYHPRKLTWRERFLGRIDR